MHKIEFATIASGSKGNCIYIGTENTKILIDAGISGKKAEQGLAELGLSGTDIDAVFVTHEHNDHVDGIGVLFQVVAVQIRQSLAAQLTDHVDSDALDHAPLFGGLRGLVVGGQQVLHHLRQQ